MKKVLIALAMGLVFLFLISKQPYGITYVMSNSIAKGYYLSIKKPANFKIIRGEIVCAKIEQPKWVEERQYLPKSVPLCKKVVAVEGDYIRIVENEVQFSRDGLNWVHLGSVQSKDSNGRDVPAHPWGSKTILKQGEFFAFGDNNAMSLDSRYLGPFKSTQIEKTLKELYVFRSNIQQ